MKECIPEPVLNYVLGICLCVGGAISYFPQYYSLIKSKQHEGISELSLFILNLGSACLCFNSFILNWDRFSCFDLCDKMGICLANLLPLIQILVGWTMVFPLYLVFLRYKVKQNKTLYDFLYITVYILFVLIIIIVGLVEKLEYENTDYFFLVSAWVFGGIFSPICSCLVWIPQIYKIIKTEKTGNLSLPMFLIQAPGNGLIILFQIISGQGITTWGTYVITMIEQIIIIYLLIIY